MKFLDISVAVQYRQSLNKVEVAVLSLFDEQQKIFWCHKQANVKKTSVGRLSLCSA